MDAFTDFKGLVDAIGDSVVVCDVDGKITFWNPASERLFGFTQAEAVGQSLDIIIPVKLRKRHWDGYHKTMASGKTRYGHTVLSVPAIDKAGRTLSIGFTVALLHDAAGNVVAIASVMRDETDRYNRDRALRKRLDEAEARLSTLPPAATP